MNALAAVRTPKVFVEASPWQSGNVAHAAFPLSHKGKMRMGKAWNWCVHKVMDADREYRILVAFDAGKNQYWAWLGAVFGHDQALIARVELHSSHDGWHCHWKTGAIEEVPRGAVKAPGKKEMRRGCGEHELTVTKSNACGLAYKLFNVTLPAGGLGL